MSKKLTDLINLDKIQHVLDHYFESRSLGKQEELIDTLNELEKCVLEALVEDFKKYAEYA